MGYKGINVLETGDRIIFIESLKDSSGEIIVAGTTSLRLYELQSDGSLKSYDFNDHTFKTTALTTATVTMTHRTGNNSTVDTGLWTYALATLTGFTPGMIYISSVNNNSASPTETERKFQYGGDEGDLPMAYGRVDDTDFSPTATTFETSLTLDVTDAYKNGALLFLTGSALEGEVGKFVTAYENPSVNANGRGKITVAAFSAAPSDGDRFVIIGAKG